MNKLINQRISGYKVVCNFNNERVLAYSRTAPQQWVVWRVDKDGGMYWGRYFNDADEAKMFFLKTVKETRTAVQEIFNITKIETEMLEGTLKLKHSNDNIYDIFSKLGYDCCDNAAPAWSLYLRYMKEMLAKQIFEILILEEMKTSKSE